MAPLHSRRARLQASWALSNTYLRLEVSLGVSLLCLDDKTLKLAERNLVRSWQEKEAHFFLTSTALTGASLPHRYVFEPFDLLRRGTCQRTRRLRLRQALGRVCKV